VGFSGELQFFVGGDAPFFAVHKTRWSFGEKIEKPEGE
jgi:hypothetical protein